MYGCVLFMEDEAWDVYVSTPVYIKKQNVRYYASL